MAAIKVPWKQIQGIIGDVTEGIGEGTTVTLKRPGSNDAIAGEPWEGPAEPTSNDTFSDIPAVVIPDVQDPRDDGTDISVRKIRITIAGGDLAVTPELGWTLTNNKDGLTYSVTKVKTIQPGRDVLVYSLEASR